MQTLLKIANCVYLSMLFVLCCIPVITAGSAVCALYYSVDKVIGKGRSYATESFFGAFQKNFKQATLFWLLFLAAESVFYADITILRIFVSKGHSIGNTWVFFAVLMILFAVYGMWVLSMTARFENRLEQILKNSFIMMIRFPVSSLLVLILLMFLGTAVYLLPWLVFLLPSVVFWLISASLEKQFVRFMTEEEKKQLLY